MSLGRDSIFPLSGQIAAVDDKGDPKHRERWDSNYPAKVMGANE